MAIDSRQKRASASHMITPILHGAQSDTVGVSDIERWAVSHIYSGIAIGAAVIVVIKETLSRVSPIVSLIKFTAPVIEDVKHTAPLVRLITNKVETT